MFIDLIQIIILKKKIKVKNLDKFDDKLENIKIKLSFYTYIGKMEF